MPLGLGDHFGVGINEKSFNIRSDLRCNKTSHKSGFASEVNKILNLERERGPIRQKKMWKQATRNYYIASFETLFRKAVEWKGALLVLPVFVRKDPREEKTYFISILPKKSFRAPVAQLVEHTTFNRRVESSSLSGRKPKLPEANLFIFLAFKPGHARFLPLP